VYTLSTFLVGHELRLSETQILASGSVAFDKVHFEFDENWAGLSKVALFWGADGNAYGSMVDAEGNAAVPWEALATGGRIKFGVYGVTGSGDDAVRATSTLIHYKLPEGAWTEDGQQPTPAEQTIIEQAIAAIQSAVENLDREPIIRDGIWYTWDIHADDYVSTGVPAIGPAAGFGSVSATVDDNTGTPSVEVMSSGPDTAKSFSFAFHNMKGPTGDVTPAAQQAASDAQTAAQAAAGSATDAAGSASAASGSASAAAGSATNAAGSASAASGSAQAAAGSAADAAASAQDAEDAAAGIAANLSAIQSSIAIIVDGDTVTTTIAEGQYVYIKGSTVLAEGLYTANSAVPSGTTVSNTYFTAVSGGGLNAIQQSLAFTGWEPVYRTDSPSTVFGYVGLSGDIVVLNMIDALDVVPSASGWITLATLPAPYRPSQRYDFMAVNNKASSQSTVPLQMQVGSDGVVKVWAFSTTRFSIRGYFNYYKG